jgi:hypothetical protein
VALVEHHASRPVNPISWIRWRMRAPHSSGDPARDFGAQLGWQETAHVHRELAASGHRLGRIGTPNIKIAVWSAHAAVWLRAARTRDVGTALLDRFFEGYTSQVSRELGILFGSVPDLREAFTSRATALADKLAPPSTLALPEEYPPHVGRVLAEHFRSAGVDSDPLDTFVLGAHYTSKLIICAQAIDQLTRLQVMS